MNRHAGFNLVELMIVVAIIAVITAIALPSYQSYVIRTKRADMMNELQNIATQIETAKLAQGSYGNITAARQTAWAGSFPRQGTALYTISLPATLSSSWTITATPVAGGQMASDGTLTLNANGQKCRGTTCGMSEEWKN